MDMNFHFSLPIKQSYWKVWVKEIVTRSEQLDLYLLIVTITCPNLYERAPYRLTARFKNTVSIRKTLVTNWKNKQTNKKTKRQNYYKWDKREETI